MTGMYTAYVRFGVYTTLDRSQGRTPRNLLTNRTWAGMCMYIESGLHRIGQAE